MNINQTSIKDVLSWNEFLKKTSEEKSYPPKKIKLYNRLIAHTNNFFAIAAIGAFTPGYLMIVAKELIPSFSLIKDENLYELKWFVEVLSKSVEDAYDRQTIQFEHGMCACVGGLDRAHIHLMSVNNNVSNDIIKNSINKALLNRRSGISSIEINGYKLENIHDIKTFLDSGDSKSYKLNGRQLSYEDINNNLDIKNWPRAARPHVKKGGHYVYFKTSSNNSSFFTNRNFQTQLGREIVYEIEIKTNHKFKSLTDEILKKNTYANIWQWQNYSFSENMSKTMNDLIPSLEKIKSDNNSNKYNFKTLKKKN